MTPFTQTNQSRFVYDYDPSTLARDTETIQYALDHNGPFEFTRVLDRSNDPLGALKVMNYWTASE